MNRKKSIWITVPFLTIVFGFSAINFLTPDKAESVAENRVLATKPILGKTGDKTYTESYEKYYTDQFAFRDQFLKLYMKNDILLGKTDVKGYYLGDDFILQKNTLRLSESEGQSYSNIINEYGSLFKDKGKDVYYVSTPQKENILTSLLPWYSNLNILLENNQRFMSGINRDNIHVLSLRDKFLENFNQNTLKDFYFKTDNHWNGIGAYEGFKFIINDMSKNSKLNVKINDDSYTTVDVKNKDFLGVYNRNLYELYPTKERIPYVYSKESTPRKCYLHNSKEFNEVDVNSIIAPGIKDSVLSYPTAYTSSNLHYKVVNPSAPINKKLLIYRDSYHSAMSWLFEDIFREVEVVDPRYIYSSNTTNKKIALSTDADIVLFMFNDLGFTNMVSELNR